MFTPPMMCYGLSMRLDTETSIGIGYILLMLAVLVSAVLGACGDDGEPADMCRLPEFVAGPLDYRTCECGEWADACYYKEGYLCSFAAKGTLCVKQCRTDEECPPYEGFAAQCLSSFCGLPCEAGCPDGMVCGGSSSGCVWEREP